MKSKHLLVIADRSDWSSIVARVDSKCAFHVVRYGLVDEIPVSLDDPLMFDDFGISSDSAFAGRPQFAIQRKRDPFRWRAVPQHAGGVRHALALDSDYLFLAVSGKYKAIAYVAGEVQREGLPIQGRTRSWASLQLQCESNG